MRWLFRTLRDGKVVARLVNVAIVLLAVLGGLEFRPPPVEAIIAFLLVSGLSIQIARGYAESIGHEIENRRVLPLRERLAFLGDPVGIAGTLLWLWAALWFFVSEIGLLRVPAAFMAVEWSLVVVLLGLGFLSRRLAGGSIGQSVAVGTSAAIAGWVLADLRMLSDLFRRI